MPVASSPAAKQYYAQHIARYLSATTAQMRCGYYQVHKREIAGCCFEEIFQSRPWAHCVPVA